MKKIRVISALFLCLSLVCVSATSVFAQELKENIVHKFWRKVYPLPDEQLELAGFIKNETAVHMAGGFDRFMKINNVMGLKANYKITDWLELFTYYRWFWDAVYTVEDRLYGDVSFEDVNRKLRTPEKMQWLRECYLDIYTDRLDIRAGKQQVVWGTADGVRILDMVNPLDYREWTLRSYSETRIPLWMINIEGELMMDGHLQLLLIPDYQPNYYAPPGAPFTLRTVDIGQKGVNTLNRYGITTSSISERPGRQFEHTKIGVRWQNVIGGWDYTLNYLHTYDFASAAYTIWNLPGGQFSLTRRSEQIDVFGLSFSKTLTEGFLADLLKGWTLRGEFAYIKNGAMNYGIDESIEGTVDVDQYNYCLGFDRSFWTNWLFSYQFIQFIADKTEDFPQFYTNPFTGSTTSENTLLFGPTRGPLDTITTMMTLKIATDFMHERLKPEILLIYGFDNDWRISPKVNFEINDEWTIAGGLHIFGGDEQGLNGQFDKNDQIFVETTYNW